MVEFLFVCVRTRALDGAVERECMHVCAIVSVCELERERVGRVVVALGQFPATLSFARVSCIRNETLVLVTAPLTTKC